ncbi:MAG: D-alanyl-D-alanine carboxypeptidase [Pseudolysinimonas sp.]|uniref:D-alanyl-D-alanine carboxypeptidase/D-alanyl-D-alanine-endopeptidase n=1 Tax=Pseudolysinimonas sp. TaxID=2680009 RepID=UPI003C71BA30
MTDEQPISRRAAREAAAPAARRRSRQKPAASSDGADAGAEKPRGIGALFAKHPTAWLTGAIAVVFVLLGTGAVLAGVSVGSAAAVVPTATPTPDPPRDVPDGALVASRLRTCSIAGQATDPRLMALSGYVVRADTGEVLFDRAGTTPARTASVLKLLTAAAALTTLGPDFQIRTSVYPGSQAGSIVLVGRGDATLSRLPAGQESVYKGAPKLDSLAQQVLANYDDEITNLVLDANYWSPADKWDPAWKRSEQTQGYHSEVTALQVDGDRANPGAQDSARSTDPIGRAGQWFLDALRANDTEGKVAGNVTITTGSAVNTSTVLGEVASQPLSVIIPHMLLVSDNTMAEMLARITSKESALNGSAASLQQAIPSALTEYGITGAALTIKDGSGLSEFNAVPPSIVTQLMIQVNAGAPNLDVVRAGLPVAGQSGTLASRFTGENAVARGQVFAKTGWIDTAYTLGGLVQAADGTVFAFAFYAIGDGIQSNARAALDTLTTGVFICGDNLSNN